MLKDIHMKTLQAEARTYRITMEPGMKKEELYDKVEAAKSADKDLQKAKEISTNIESKESISDVEQEWREAMALKRVIITSNDPDDSEDSGVMYSVTMSDGKFKKADLEISISKFIPFDTVWMVSQAMVDSLQECYYNRKKKYKIKKGEGSDFGFELVPTKKYNIDILDDITEDELNTIRTRQLAESTLEG